MGFKGLLSSGNKRQEKNKCDKVSSILMLDGHELELGKPKEASLSEVGRWWYNSLYKN